MRPGGHLAGGICNTLPALAARGGCWRLVGLRRNQLLLPRHPRCSVSSTAGSGAGFGSAAVPVTVDSAFNSWQHARITSVELWGSFHIFVVTEDEYGRRLAHHFDYSGYTAHAFAASEPGQYRLAKRGVPDAAGLSALGVQRATVAEGLYTLSSNNCIHAAKRGFSAARLLQGGVKLIFLAQAAVVGGLAVTLGGTLAAACYLTLTRSSGSWPPILEAELDHHHLDDLVHVIKGAGKPSDGCDG